jgi:Histidine kinase-, DNA gyrase B-, and HSP90-like ATPase
MREDLAAMTRWNLRRRLGGTQDDVEREYRPVTAVPAAGRPSTAAPSTAAPPAAQPAPDPATSAQPGSLSQAGHWFPSGSGSWPGDAPAGAAAGPAPGPPSAPVPPSVPGPPPASAVPAEPAPGAARDAAAWPGQPEAVPPDRTWPDICDQFGLRLLVLAEQLRTSLDELENDEDDPERLRRLYQVDHAVTRMRRACRDLRTLAGQSEEELAGFTTSLLDVIRMATSAIERYTQVTIGRVTDLAVLGYVADDIGSVMAALLDNATKYSPGTVTVSGHLLEGGGVMYRIEDAGIGIGADRVDALNAAFAGPVPEVDERTGWHTGFPVVHRIARKYSIGVRLAVRPLPSSGTVAMVTIPPHLLCEVPAEDVQRRPGPPTGSSVSPAPRPSAVSDRSRGEPARPHQRQQQPRWEPPELPDGDQPRPVGDLPRRERASLRGDQSRSRPQEPAKVPTPEEQAAARRAFADELSAFSLGAAGSPDAADDTATEEEAKQ